MLPSRMENMQAIGSVAMPDLMPAAVRQLFSISTVRLQFLNSTLPPPLTSTMQTGEVTESFTRSCAGWGAV